MFCVYLGSCGSKAWLIKCILGSCGSEPHAFTCFQSSHPWLETQSPYVCSWLLGFKPLIVYVFSEGPWLKTVSFHIMSGLSLPKSQKSYVSLKSKAIEELRYGPARPQEAQHGLARPGTAWGGLEKRVLKRIEGLYSLRSDKFFWKPWPIKL